VLLKGVDERGLLFFTNMDSRKAKELAENPQAAVVLYWAGLERQVRVTGEVTAASRSEVEAYHERRPRQSQLAAAASRQSELIADRDELQRRFAETAEQYEGQQVPCPAFWGGYRIAPDAFEFWQGRTNRLHDRLRYRPTGDGGWRLERLSP
jgi:pyridoxamine 5'-phosphate oxidase